MYENTFRVEQIELWCNNSLTARTDITYPEIFPYVSPTVPTSHPGASIRFDYKSYFTF